MGPRTRTGLSVRGMGTPFYAGTRPPSLTHQLLGPHAAGFWAFTVRNMPPQECTDTPGWRLHSVTVTCGAALSRTCRRPLTCRYRGASKGTRSDRNLKRKTSAFLLQLWKPLALPKAACGEDGHEAGATGGPAVGWPWLHPGFKNSRKREAKPLQFICL